MTQAFNLSQLANGVNTSGQINASSYLYNQVPVANGGTALSSAGAAGNMLLATSASAYSSVTMPTFGFRNRIINGAMMIDQRNAGASVTVSSYGYVLDRFGFNCTGGGAFTAQRSTTVPTGFTTSQALTVSTADSSIAAGDVYQSFHKIEGYNVADFGFGTANAQTFTLSFWVRSSITGTYAVGLCNNAFNRSYVATYTVNAANTWEQKVITVAGDTSGTWTTDNSIGLNISFDLGSGSNYNTTAGAWGAGNFSRTSGSVNWIATTGATFYITGVQLEKGSTATSFDYRPYGTELALCQRYLPAWTGSGVYGMGVAANSTDAYAILPLPVPTRVAPTGIYASSGTGFIVSDITSSFNTTTSMSFSQASVYTLSIKAVSAGQVSNRPITIQGNASNSIVYGTGCEL